MSLPSTEAFSTGNRCRAATAALTKKAMKPRRTPCVFSKRSPYCLRSAMIGPMLTSLKVVRIALLACDCSRRSATRARRRDIGTLCSGRSPSGTVTLGAGGNAGAAVTKGLAGLAAGGFAAGSGAAAAGACAASASALVTRPPRPLPATSPTATPFSSRILRAAGNATPAAPATGAGLASARAGAAAAAAGGAAAAATVPACAAVSMRAITSPATTVSPSPLTISTNTPLSGAGSSRTTLSVSMSIRFSSRATASPAFLCHETSVASATDSESCGTLTSMIMFSPF
ncbi:MAG: hypothetical protein FAZ92_00005 [Accumulibacter sp.]|nr:MAG: hypothetical protein FAZ92_00005 [Accumulibacter sp.]